MAPWQEVLVNAVASRRCLWDIAHTDYKDTRNVRANNWADVTEELKSATSEDFNWNGRNIIIIIIIK